MEAVNKMRKADTSTLTKALYWGSTGLLSAMMAFSAFSYLTSPEMTAAFVHLGFPGYFRIELALAKLLGVAAILFALPWPQVREWAYAGFAFTFISAFIAHASVGDPLPVSIAPLVALVLLIVSYRTAIRVRG